jgi:hypothetical protein
MPPLYVSEIYEPLKGKQIRLVRLEPGAWDAMISCKLSTVLLDFKPDYEALSYVWGDARDQEDILLDNQTFKVRKNLVAALRHLRLKEKGRDLWVDAVCINQSDDPEKNRQFQFMRMIYGDTKGLLIWLGPEDENSDAAMDLVNRVAGQFVPELSNDARCRNNSIMLNELENLTRSRSLDSFYEYLQRPWFSRAWIVQELLLP